MLEQAQKLIRCRQFSAAEEVLRKAIRLDGKNRILHTALGEALEGANQFEKAILAHLDAWRLDPTGSKNLMHIGSFLMRMRQDEEAIRFLRDAVRYDRQNVTALSRLTHLQRHYCDWEDDETEKERMKVIRVSEGIIDPLAALTLFDEPDFQKNVSISAAKIISTKTVAPKFKRPVGAEERIRLCYLSNDFRDHATMYLIGRQLELHDKDRFKIFIYDYGEVNEQEGRKKAESAADVYRQVSGMSNSEVSKIAKQDGLDIAIDLKGFTKGNRISLFCERLAPVQVSYLGYPGTTGLQAIDYMIADWVTIPEESRKHYSEKILYLPDCYQPNDNIRPVGGVVTRASEGLPEGAIVFCTFNNPCKISPTEFEIWMNLLSQVPDSVLWFFAPSAIVRENVQKKARAHGVDSERIVFANQVRQEEHISRLKLADVFLDTFCYNGHTTASDALRAGVPVVTKTGKQFAARVASSLLSAVGVSELAAGSVTQYQALALKLARDPDYLAEVKARVKKGIAEGPLYDTEKFTRNFEALMEMALDRYNEGLEPDHLSLN